MDKFFGSKVNFDGGFVCCFVFENKIELFPGMRVGGGRRLGNL